MYAVPNNLKIKDLRKLELIESPQPTTQKPNRVNCVRKLQKNCCKKSLYFILWIWLQYVAHDVNDND